MAKIPDSWAPLMANPLISSPKDKRHLTQTLPSVSASKMVGAMQQVTNTVMTHGAVVVTRHDQPSMVLLSVDRYLELEQAAAPNLDALTQRFDDLYAGMQGDAAALAMEDAFALSPAQLGQAAVHAVK
jgi:PHD/YefM family antitoxin component YafN of YafNO toxin-antitoxin module